MCYPTILRVQGRDKQSVGATSLRLAISIVQTRGCLFLTPNTARRKRLEYLSSNSQLGLFPVIAAYVS